MEDDIKIVTRGKNLTIENLGHIVDPSVTPSDYFGELFTAIKSLVPVSEYTPVVLMTSEDYEDEEEE